jgi:hypothetical protein
VQPRFKLRARHFVLGHQFQQLRVAIVFDFFGFYYIPRHSDRNIGEALGTIGVNLQMIILIQPVIKASAHRHVPFTAG